MTQAVIFENQTRITENANSGSYIKFEQDTTADLFVSNNTSGQIELYNLSTFNSTFTNLNTTNFSFLQYFNIANKTGEWGNGSSIEVTFEEDRKITINASDTFSWLSFEEVNQILASLKIFIFPNVNDTVVHIILGKRLVF